MCPETCSLRPSEISELVERQPKVAEDVGAGETMAGVAPPPANIPRPGCDHSKHIGIDVGAGLGDRRGTVVAGDKAGLCHIGHDLVEGLSSIAVGRLCAH